MLEKIINIYKDSTEEYDPGVSFGSMSRSLDSFAHAINSTINSKYPEVFKMNEEEYSKIDGELQSWLKSDEGIETFKRFQLLALAELSIEAIKTMTQLSVCDKDVTNALNDILNDHIKESSDDREAIESQE